MKIFIILVLLLLQESHILAGMELSTEIKVINQNITENVLPSARHYRHAAKFARNTVKGTRCIFPFIFRGVQFIDCAAGIHQPNPWCATSTDIETKELKDWEVCSLDKREDDDTCKSLSPSSCMKRGISTLCPLMCSRGIGAIQPTRDKLTIKGTRCIFPFVDRGVHYNECAPDGHLETPWCATRIKDNREYSQWDFCAPTASELASMKRFGMNDEAMEDFVESLQEAEDISGSCADEIKDIAQRINKIQESLGREPLGHSNSSVIVDTQKRRYRSCADQFGERDRIIEKIKIFPFSHRRYRGHYSHHRHGDDSDDGVDVLCDQDRDGGGWTIIQMRRDVYPRENFHRDWHDYVEGFGQLDGEFWIGLEVIHALTSQDTVELHIDLEDWEGGRRWAKYTTFRVHSASEQYKLDIEGYSGDAGDSMKYHNTRKFYTKDKDVGTCAQTTSKGGWWYHFCEHANLNGQQDRGTTTKSQQGINWYHWRGHSYSLKAVTMKLRPRHMYG